MNSDDQDIQETKVRIDVWPTPNPNALKFSVDNAVKSKGHSTYRSPAECGENELALALFMIKGVDQVHFFENSITITKFIYEEWLELESKVIDILNREVPRHDPDYYDPDPEEDRRKALTPELMEIEEILDRTIRAGLQADGGDLITISLEDNILMVQYQGACGTCPSSTAGTLEAIKSILRNEYHPDIDVYIAPESF